MQEGSVALPEVPGEQGFDLVEGVCDGQFSEEMAEVGVRLKAIGLGGLDEGIEIGAGLGAMDGIGEEPVFSADDEGADGLFGEVIVERPGAIVEEADELGPLAVEVSEGLAEFGLRESLR